MNELEFKN